jgi:hypothetical protein
MSSASSFVEGIVSDFDAGRFVVRVASSADDVDRVAAFNGVVHGAETARITQALFLHHPKTELSDLFFVVHVPSQEVVSSLCLIPWTWCFDGAEIAAGEMGIVGTLEPFRRRGLVRAQVRHFRRRMSERRCLVSHIQGIPYFYRQFGYEYALPLEGGLRLELRDIPPEEEKGFVFQRAALADLPALRRLYDEAAADLSIYAPREDEAWRYLLAHGQGSDTECERWLVRSPEGDTQGYFGVPLHHFGEELVVAETSRLSVDGAMAVLRRVSLLARERGQPGIRLNLPESCTLMRLARSLGARDLGRYAWQVNIPDRAQLLRALAPVLERRVAQSALAGLTREVRLSLYEETLCARFESGRLQDLTREDPNGAETIRMPPAQFVPLVLGHRSREELQAQHPDVSVAPSERMVLDVLFPRVEAFLYLPY